MAMPVLDGVMLFMLVAVFSSCRCTHMKAFNIVGKLDICLDKLSPGVNTLILVPVGRGSPIIAFPYPVGHRVGNTFYQHVG